MLGRNLDKQEKLYDEVCQRINDDDIVTLEMVQKMPYLRACIKEGLGYVQSLKRGRRYYNPSRKL